MVASKLARYGLPWVVLAVLGCGAAKSAPSSPAYPAQEEAGSGDPAATPAPDAAPPPPTAAPGMTPPTTLAVQEEDEVLLLATLTGAEQLFAGAERELATLAPTPSAPAGAGAGASAAPKASALAAGTSDCVRACKAFGSMQRAADAICRLTGPTDTRCTRARAVVASHEPRVAVCRCGG